MKNRVIVTLVLLAAAMVPSKGQQVMVENLRPGGVVTVQDLKPAEAKTHPVAARALSRGEKPGAFSNVRYRFAGNVKPLSPSQKSRIKLKQDGILDLTGQAFRPHPDTVYVDPMSDLVLQAEPVDEQQMIAVRPGLTAVFDDIEIPQQEVPVTLANTISMAEGVVESAMQLNNAYAVNLQFDSVIFLLDRVNDDSLTAALVGKIQLSNPRVEGKYSKNGGYRLVFMASEEIDLKVYTTMKVTEEIRTPIWGTEIKISDLGKCQVGLFLLTTVEGKVTLSFEIQQGIEMALGASGSTFWYVPTSIKNISTIDYWCDIGYNVSAEIKAFSGLLCTANLKIKGYNALDVYVKGGMEGTVATDGSLLTADIGFRLKAGGKVVSKSFTLLDKYYSLWKTQQPDYKGYSMIVHEACAWGDHVVGEVHRITDSKSVAGGKDTIPWQGSLTVIVKHPDNVIKEYPSSTDAGGIFITTGVPLKKGDKVMVKMEGVSSPGPAVDATIPFREISLWSADYYAGVAEGAVAGSRSRWVDMVNTQARGTVAPGIGAVKNTQADKLKGAMAPKAMADRLGEFKKNLIVYRGPIEFITQSLPTAVLKAPAVQGTRAPVAEKPRANSGTVSSPLGMFLVSGLTFEPGQKVKARAIVEGFTIESDWVETEGLMVSAIEHDSLGFSVRPGSETVRAHNSFVLVSPVRSTTVPTGSVKMVRGADVPHGSLTGAQAVPEFPEAKKAKLWFSTTSVLAPLEGYPGTAIASTGPWSTTITYSSPGDAINPAKNRKHDFEVVTYIFKNHDLGYSYFNDSCVSCTSPVNIVEKIGSQTKPGAPGLQQQVQSPVKQPQLAKPVIKK